MGPDIFNTYESNVVQIRAVQITAESIHDIADRFKYPLIKDETAIQIPTLEGVMEGPLGWWFIIGTEDEPYACKDSVFQKKYHAYSGDNSEVLLEGSVEYVDTDDAGYIHQIINIADGGTHIVNNYYYSESEKDGE